MRPPCFVCPHDSRACAIRHFPRSHGRHSPAPNSLRGAVTSVLTFAGQPTKMRRRPHFRQFANMDVSLVSGVAALTGAAIGGLTSATAAWFTQRAIAKSQWLASETARRQDIYRDFIEVSAKCYIDALQHDNPDLPGLVNIYAKISRMRVLSATNIV